VLWGRFKSHRPVPFSMVFRQFHDNGNRLFSYTIYTNGSQKFVSTTRTIYANNSYYWYDYVRLETDIDLSGRVYSSAVIGKDTSIDNGYQGNNFFGGIFDGNGHTIKNLAINSYGLDECYLDYLAKLKMQS
jgi:hypothetical protein